MNFGRLIGVTFCAGASTILLAEANAGTHDAQEEADIPYGWETDGLQNVVGVQSAGHYVALGSFVPHNTGNLLVGNFDGGSGFFVAYAPGASYQWAQAGAEGWDPEEIPKFFECAFLWDPFDDPAEWMPEMLACISG